MLCSRCGNENPENANYCLICGEPTGSNIPKPIEPAPVPIAERQYQNPCTVSLGFYFLATVVFCMTIVWSIAGYNTWEHYGSGWDKAYTVLTSLVEGFAFAGVLAGIGYLSCRK